MHDELCERSATELVGLLRTRQLSAREVLDAHLARIERTNPAVNAIVTLLPDRARAQAKDADDALARGEATGLLHGLPIAHKDLVNTAGIRTTFGSPIFADWVPDEDDLLVERIRAAGAILVGKTNTPEFGAGSHTFNPVFGPNAESLRPEEVRGRIVGRRSRGRRMRDAADRGRGRLRRVAPQPREFLQRRGVPSHPRARSVMAGSR